MSSSVSGKPSVRSIAKATGLSTATVSRVLNQSDKVNEKTRNKVLQAVEDHGYIINSAARALSTQRTKTIGIIVPTLSNSIFAGFLNTIEIELAKHGYALVIATSDGDPSVESKRTRELLNMGVEGLVLSGAKHDTALINMMKERDIPVVCTSVYRTHSGLPAIGYDNRGLGRQAMTYLYDNGHNTIHIAHSSWKNNDRTELRVDGIKKAAKKYGIEISFTEVPLSVDGGAKAAKAVMEAGKQITACLCTSDVLALGMLLELDRNGIKVPKDISVMGFDNLEWSALSKPRLTSFDLPIIAMGKKTAQAIVNRLDNNEPILSAKLSSKIIERESVLSIKNK